MVLITRFDEMQAGLLRVKLRHILDIYPDTNVVSELRKIGDGKVDLNAVTWITAEDAASCYFRNHHPGTLSTAFPASERRRGVQGGRLRPPDDHVRKEFAGRILSIDDAIATRCAHLHIPDRRNEADALIAATGLVHNMAVVTLRNPRDFEGTGVVVIDLARPIRLI